MAVVVAAVGNPPPVRRARRHVRYENNLLAVFTRNGIATLYTLLHSLMSRVARVG